MPLGHFCVCHCKGRSRAWVELARDVTGGLASRYQDSGCHVAEGTGLHGLVQGWLRAVGGGGADPRDTVVPNVSGAREQPVPQVAGGLPGAEAGARPNWGLLGRGQAG